MNTRFSSLCLIGLLACSLSGSVIAQAQIRSATGNNPSQGSVAPAPSANESLVYELQALQQEVLNLRGQLEKQSHELKRLKQQRLDDYLDLDKRLSEMSQRLAPASPVPVDATTPPSQELATTPPELSLAGVNSQQGDALYKEAIDLLLNKQDYEGAQTRFSQYLNDHPKGSFTPNVYYWQGQILFAGADKAKAGAIFERLIEEYPSHQKIPDAKFKLARIYFDQGKKKEAREILEQVATSDSDAALLAKSFITKNY